MEAFDPSDLKKLYKPPADSKGEDNGQVTIIGGSTLFHGAPLFSLKTASRLVDMVFFSSPERSIGNVVEELKSKLLSFIWVPWEEIGYYIEKSDAALVGPGLMSYRSEKDKRVAYETMEICKALFTKFKDKKWVIDAGALQTMDASWIPEGSIITPNAKEFQKLFAVESSEVESMAKKHKCIIVLKGPTTIVTDGEKVVEVAGGNAGLTKGGSGDALAGLTVGLLAKNDPFLAATCASYIVKKAAEDLAEKVGMVYNADDLVEQIPQTFHNLID